VHLAKTGAWADQPPAPLQDLGQEHPAKAQVGAGPRTGSRAKAYQQCGGKQWTGPFSCEAGCQCMPHGEYYSQCTPPAGAYTCRAQAEQASAASGANFAPVDQESLRFLITEDVIASSGAPGRTHARSSGLSGKLSDVARGTCAIALASVSMAATLLAWRRPRHRDHRGQLLRSPNLQDGDGGLLQQVDGLEVA